MTEGVTFDRAALLDAFDAIGQAAVANRATLDIAVYGGSALMLASNVRFATEDVGGVLRDVAIPEFLDAFYGAAPVARPAMLREEPRLSGDVRLDALAAAIAEYLSKRYALPVIPAWVGAPGRVLAEPWFTTSSKDDGMLEYLAFSSPAEFRHHNIFTEAVPLRRASQARMVR